MSEIMTVVEGRIEVFGKTVTERKMNVVRMAGASACTALLASGGKVGKVAAERIAKGGFVSLADQASRGNYRQVAEYFAAELGLPVIIAKRADFEALPSRMEELVEKAKLAKNGGFRTDKKTGVEVPGNPPARGCLRFGGGRGCRSGRAHGRAHARQPDRTGRVMRRPPNVGSRAVPHRVPKGTFGAARPLTAATGDVDRVMQGGMPPVPYRASTGRWLAAWGNAREPFASRQVRGEHYGDRKEFPGRAW